MNFEQFIKEGKVRIGQPDLQKAKALIKMSEHEFNFIIKLKLNENSSSIKLVNCYESLRQFLEAMCLKEGFKV